MKKLTNKKTLITALCAILVVVAMVFTLTACDGNKDKEPTSTTTPSTTEEVVTTKKEEVPTIEDETTTETETTTEEVVETEAPTQKPTEAPKPTPKPTEAPTRAPETTKKQEPKPTQAPKPVVNQNDDVEVKDKDREELPTYADGSFDMGAMNEASKEENGGTVYF